MRIVLDDMPQDPDPVKLGSQGTVVDYDEYQILVDWDEDVGRSLHLIPGVDKYHVIDPENTDELEKSWLNLAAIQDRLRSREGREGRDGEPGRSNSRERLKDSSCPRCGRLFDVRRGAVSRRIRVTNIMVCDQCGQQEAIEVCRVSPRY